MEQEWCPLRAWIQDVRTFQLEVLAMVLYCSDPVKVCIYFVFLVFHQSIICPRTLEQSRSCQKTTVFERAKRNAEHSLVHDLHVLISYFVTLVVVWRINANLLRFSSRSTFTRTTYMQRPTDLNAEALQLVTIFHPKRPPVRWSRVENLFASTAGCSKVVLVVIANPRFLVMAAIAETGTAGSPIGNCAPVRTQGSAVPL